ncbi:hypothetical protein G6F16_003124 [Rhizopus arrhizus]|uniref:Cell division control protein 25 n=1 Tax=Rhizopus oryzae TaxID=64495 RepID=A0A9P6XEP0_RHIOR|nr:hypothetical protein G6F23_001324 [Rhizopus arrhizus]KAG1424847.1 hypothetical protein G6F58_002201 [Rhizopus delemar]KAG0765209.1 hypothetical protein G6F24_004608 [Rhizopus arrhizus]KAG0795444.1 hypothetical protein G6F21_002097 [Rhizopus arrhizus]KAG0802241.1 hypothetical protein G6F22_000451 [Rhizopus arrhizus]
MTEVPIICRVQALYPFKSNDPSSLCFEQDDYIDVLTKLPSGWWDGLCNGMRGWFPSNYVKVVEEVEQILEPDFRRRNTEYRLSLLSNHTPEWIIQKTEDGVDTYYYNTITGEMRIDPPNEEGEQVCHVENSGNRWSDQSTLTSSNIDRESQYLPAALTKTLQTNSSYNQETASISTLDHSQTIPSRPFSTINEPMTWPKLFQHIALTIHQLSASVKSEQRQTYNMNAIYIVNVIRHMLVSSNTIDKESSPIHQHTNLRIHHRAMMASLSKLVLSARSAHDDPRILSECNELLSTVKHFVSTCQELLIPLVPVDPQFVQTKEEAEPSTVVHSNRYSLQLNLAENLETMGLSIQDSAGTIMTYVNNYSGDDKNSLVVLLFTHFRNLSNQTGLFLAYLDETDFSSVLEQSEMRDLKQGKQALADALGVLFIKLQAMTSEHIEDLNACLKATREAAAALFVPIELICASVLHLAKKNRSNSNASSLQMNNKKMVSIEEKKESTIAEEIEEEEEKKAEENKERIGKEQTEEKEAKNESVIPLERHQSEIVQSSTERPSVVQRSQTTPSSDKIKKFFGDDAPVAETASTKAAVSERPDFLQYDYGPNDIVFNMEGHVKGGTLPALVERLTMHDYFDMNFINTFLLTYRSFCASSDLLDLLEARYNLKCPEGLTEEEATMWEEKKLKLVRLRVFNVLKNWLELYYNEDDSVLLDRLMEFIETHIRTTLKFSNGQLESLIQKRKEGVAVENVGLKKMVLTLPDPPEPIFPKNRKRVKLLEIDILEMARQLTIMDFKLYSSIRPIECLDKAWSRDDDSVAVNIRASIEYCNQVTSWVSDVILSQQDIKKRSVMIKYWVQVAEKCRMLNNFNTCMAILSAFDNSSVGRLKRTWEAVGARTNQILQQIRKLMGANRNFTEYRALIHSVNPPCIPFLGIYLQDLTFIEDGNSNELKKNKELINFAKRAKTAEVIREIQQYQSSLYQLKPVEEIQDFIKSHLLSTRDEEQLYNESLKIEPREREDEKITRLLQESGFL